ncbi:diguanylate cyclase domain-containing protein [Actinoplanes sp. GCM10030250]|uniref:sensor domain-containing diguanylate cyclase n=1 Tax=Actinoplanes sp. GCM10030250 TaxID=3273376 RepID=UPI003605DC9B
MSTERDEHDHGDRAATGWMRGAFAAFYVALAITNYATLTGLARPIMTAVGAVTAVVLGMAAAGRLPLRRPAGNVLLALLPVIGSVAQVVMTAQLHFTTLLMLGLVCIGTAVPSRRIAAAAGTLGCAGWLIAITLQAPLRTAELGFYAVQLTISAVLAAILHETVRRRHRQLRVARDEVAAVAERFTSLFEASPSGVGIADEDGRIVAVNAAFCELVGRSEDELIGSDSAPFLDTPADDSAVAATGTSAGIERRIVRPDGTERWVWATAGRSRKSWTLLQLQDITDRHLAEAAVHESDRLLAAVSAAARRIRTGEDARSTIIDAIRDLAEADNVTLLEPPGGGGSRHQAAPTELVATGVAGAEVLGTRVPLDGTSMIARVYGSGEPIFLADPALDPRVSPSLLKLIEGRSLLWQPVIDDGKVIAVLVVGWKRHVASVSDHRARAVALLGDETALALTHERLLRRLEQMAFTDSLTGLPNRRAWQTQLAALMTESRPLVVAIADLDHFKHYNDTYGHPAGDDLLSRAATAYFHELHDGDLIARWGGEEFVLALPGRTPAEAAALLDRIRLATPGAETCSIGYALWDTTESAEHLLERADQALYAAKNNGRNTISAADQAVTLS